MMGLFVWTVDDVIGAVFFALMLIGTLVFFAWFGALLLLDKVKDWWKRDGGIASDHPMRWWFFGSRRRLQHHWTRWHCPSCSWSPRCARCWVMWLRGIHSNHTHHERGRS